MQFTITRIEMESIILNKNLTLTQKISLDTEAKFKV